MTKMDVSENKENGTAEVTEQLSQEIQKMDVSGIEESPQDDDSKYKEEDQPRRVIVKNLDFKATAEDIDNFFKDEKFGKIEHVSKKFRKMGSWKERKEGKDKEGKPLKQRFNGVVILTFQDEDEAKKFIDIEDLKFKDRKVRKYCLSESDERKQKFIEKKEEMKKKKANEKKEKKANEEKKKSVDKTKADKSTKSSDSVVVCRGFHMNAESLQEVMKYFYDNHENVTDVNMKVVRDPFGYQRWDDKAFVTFLNKGAADTFKDLAYVRFKGNLIQRCSMTEFKNGGLSKGGQDKSGVKRKAIDETELEKGAAIKITGIKNKFTKVLDIKDKLRTLEVKWEDVVFVQHAKGEDEAQVRLKGEAAKTVAAVIKRLNASNILMGDEVSASRITGKAEQELTEKTLEHLSAHSKKAKKDKAKQQKNFLENY